ncbi:HdeD family acid-resistance protein [Paracoccus marinaquae]|uniref:DUF308 domain-containing protein n=1 Tax=Paracoccus marinaquae TaxID=2841926 RepID=A0ABS6AJS8_9RHOB|nr:DUF308 domain-containing protein [Paracoccus marinaquae]MBU3030372.1 DUF308 domain-containing protein [Paracoccus marinaquae]
MTNRTLWIVLGVLSVITGIFALANPLAATLTAEQLAGWGFLILGILELFAAFRQPDRGGRIWIILVGIAFVLLGVMLLAKPLAGIISLTLMVAMLFMATGIFKVVMSFSLRGTGAFWLLLISGAISVLLAVMIFGNFPAAAATILGILLAVELISSGISMIALASVSSD